MTTVRAAFGGADPGATAGLRDALAPHGWVEADEGSPAETAVYLDHPRTPGALGSVPARSWIEGLEAILGHAFGFARDVRGRLPEDGGLFVVVTSTAGVFGVAERSLDSAVSAGLIGLARSLAVETPGLTVVSLSTRPPAGAVEPDGVADVVAALAGSIPRSGGYVTLEVET